MQLGALSSGSPPPRHTHFPSGHIVPRPPRAGGEPRSPLCPPRRAPGSGLPSSSRAESSVGWGEGRGRGRRCQSPRGARAARLRIRPPAGAGSAGGPRGPGVRPREARLGRRCDRAGVRGRERAEVGAVRRRREGCERAGVEGLCGGAWGMRACGAEGFSGVWKVPAGGGVNRV